MFELYIMSVVITSIGMWYKYNVSSRWKGYSFRDKDWLLIFLPIINFFMMFWTVMLIVFDIALKIEDFFGDNR